jgi:formate/nitrite transporter FocA (FNT family)
VQLPGVPTVGTNTIFHLLFSLGLHIVKFVNDILYTEKHIAIYSSVTNKSISRNIMKSVRLLCKAPYSHSLYLFCAVLLECFFVLYVLCFKNQVSNLESKFIQSGNVCSPSPSFADGDLCVYCVWSVIRIIDKSILLSWFCSILVKTFTLYLVY